jgi:hypothetical protein
MAHKECPECGRQLPKNHTRCLSCDDLKYQAELENPHVTSTEKVGFSQSLAEIAKNRKARKAEAKEAQLDSAFAWGTAIADGENDLFRRRLSELAENTKNRKAEEMESRLDPSLPWGMSDGEFVIQNQTKSTIETVFLGGAGIPMQTYEKSSLVISKAGFVIGRDGYSIWSKSFEGLIGLQVSGEGLLQSGGGWIGGGLGVGGALKGALFASVMNSLTTRTHNDCYFRFIYPGIEGTFQVLSHTPRDLEIALSGVKNWIETRSPSSSQGSETIHRLTKVEQIERLHQLLEKGVLSKSEFENEKAKLLGLS